MPRLSDTTPEAERGKSDVMSPFEAMQGVCDVVAVCQANGIRYVLDGAMASSFHGITRFTADADHSVEAFPDREAAFASSFGPNSYVSIEAIRQAIRDRTLFNVIHTGMGFKADIFIMKDRPFETSVMSRREPALIDPNGPSNEVVSDEDVILLKLERYRLGGEASDRQWGDVLGVLRVQGERLDEAYLDRRAAELRVLDLLRMARNEAAL